MVFLGIEMIKYTTGDLLQADVEAIVNTVNCVGVMGKGIALQFKQAFPENFLAYAKACKKHEVKLGEVFVVDNMGLVNPRYIVNFPTKGHWKSKSKIEDVRRGLSSLMDWIQRNNVKSIAIPPLGAGLGGLPWEQVKVEIEKAFSEVSGVEVLVFEPKGAPLVREMRVNTKQPKMTAGRAALIKLLNLYGEQGYKHSLLEVQKLMYFMQASGEPLRLQYQAHKFGPYAENLNHVLQRIEGHFIRGYGDRSVQAEIELIGESVKEAEKFLESHVDSKKHLQRVSKLITGFETPYGLELLATVHWIAKDSNSTLEKVISGVKGWNERKSKLMKEFHIEKAYLALKSDAWI